MNRSKRVWHKCPGHRIPVPGHLPAILLASVILLSGRPNSHFRSTPARTRYFANRDPRSLPVPRDPDEWNQAPRQNSKRPNRRDGIPIQCAKAACHSGHPLYRTKAIAVKRKAADSREKRFDPEPLGGIRGVTMTHSFKQPIFLALFV